MRTVIAESSAYGRYGADGAEGSKWSVALGGRFDFAGNTGLAVNSVGRCLTAVRCSTRSLLLVDFQAHRRPRPVHHRRGRQGTTSADAVDPGCARDAGLVSRRTHRLPRRAGRGVGDREPFTIHPDGTGLHQVTHFVDTVISHKVGFSPDGKWIVFGKGEPRGGRRRLPVQDRRNRPTPGDTDPPRGQLARLDEVDIMNVPTVIGPVTDSKLSQPGQSIG